MKKQLAGRLTQISAEALKNPTLIEKEITVPNPKNKRLTAPDLWNIRRRGKTSTHENFYY